MRVCVIVCFKCLRITGDDEGEAKLFIQLQSHWKENTRRRRSSGWKLCILFWELFPTGIKRLRTLGVTLHRCYNLLRLRNKNKCTQTAHLNALVEL